ncbi:hypothetical protein [Myroides fluvii]|uniref:hypothetical protein n=1 Tax=Myroides fluvii TaxID=2572594 RepID=UPI00131CD0B2|nr:hypothetical protein [Myroides fluvii]
MKHALAGVHTVVRCSLFVVRCLSINHQPSTINNQPSTINNQPSTINPQFFRLANKCLLRKPKPLTVNR